MNASFRVVETDFLASTNHVFFLSIVNESFIQAIEEEFLLIENRLRYLRVLFLLFLLVETEFLST